LPSDALLITQLTYQHQNS